MSKLSKPNQKILQRKNNIRLASLAGCADLLSSDLIQECARLARAVPIINSEGDSDAIASQLYRSIDSVGANVMEGFGRVSLVDQTKFFAIARGSAYESAFHAMALGWEEFDSVINVCNLLDKFILDYVDNAPDE
jgi:four helix bundle protein